MAGIHTSFLLVSSPSLARNEKTRPDIPGHRRMRTYASNLKCVSTTGSKTLRICVSSSRWDYYEQRGIFISTANSQDLSTLVQSMDFSSVVETLNSYSLDFSLMSLTVRGYGNMRLNVLLHSAESSQRIWRDRLGSAYLCLRLEISETVDTCENHKDSASIRRSC